jgi:hypothetical protein
MKPLLTTAILAFTVLIFVAAIVLANGGSSSISAALNLPSTGPGFEFSQLAPVNSSKLSAPHPFSQSPDSRSMNRLAFSKPAPSYLNNRPSPPPPLEPGVYQTYPYTIIIIATGRGIDEQSIHEAPNDNSRMPRIVPDLKVIPLPQTRQ